MNRWKAFINISWSFMAKIVAIVFVFLTDIVIARTMSIEDYASWTYFFSIKTMMIYICDLGINAGAKIVVSKSVSSVQRGTIIKVCLQVRIISAMLVSFLITVSSGWWIKFFANPNSSYGVIYPILPLIGFIVFGGAAMEFYKQLGYGIPNLRFTFVSNLLDYGFYFIITVIVLLIYKSVQGLAIGCAIAGMLAFIFGFKLLNAEYHFWKIRIPHNEAKEHGNNLIRNAIPLLFISLANLMAMELDTIMLGMLSSPEQVAIYNIGKKVCSKAPHINIAISAGIMTTFAVITNENAKLKWREYKKYFNLNLLVTIGIVACLGLFAVWGIGIVYGKEYAGAGDIIICLLPYYLMFAIKAYMSLFLDFQNKLVMRSIIMIVSLVANAIINYFLIPYYGAMGAAVSTLITEIPNFLYALGANVLFWKNKNKR